ncbi:MAG: HupE/UreJ family protein [Myxococcales bacterium]
MIGLLSLLSVAWAVAAPTRVSAHPLSPAAVVLRERETPFSYEVRFRRPELSVEQLTLTLPDHCRRDAPVTQRSGDQLEDRFELVCPRSLAGESVRVLGLAEASLSALVYVEFRNEQRARGLLTATHPSFLLPRETRPLEVFADYLRLGIEHLLTGWDHLLFIVGLMFLARGFRALVWTLSAFTFGHSVTLCLAALSVVSVPQPPVELGIAISLVVMALALLNATPYGGPTGVADSGQRSARSLLGVAFSLGLLHGLGFAGALAETGLPQHQIAVSLLGLIWASSAASWPWWCRSPCCGGRCLRGCAGRCGGAARLTSSAGSRRVGASSARSPGWAERAGFP